jgi:hypothetical protein
MDDSALIYIPEPYHFNSGSIKIMIIDTSFSIIYDIDTAFTYHPHFLYYFHLSKNKDAYLNSGYYINNGPTVHQASLRLLADKTIDILCRDTTYCTDIYTGDSLGNYYHNRHVHKTSGSIVNFPNPVSQLREFNLNNDGTYSMFGYLSATTSHCAVDPLIPNAFTYFVSKTDSLGNCLWAKTITLKNYSIPMAGSTIAGEKFDEEGNFYVNITAHDSVLIDNTLINSDTSAYNVLIIKINKNGMLEWTIPFSKSKGIRTRLITTNIDAGKNIYVSGTTDPVFINYPGIYLLNYGTILAGTGNINDLFYAKVSPPQSSNVTICPGDSFYFGGIFYFAPGTYYDTVHINTGVDSVITLTLSVDTISLALVQSNDTLFNNNNPYFIPPYSGNYAAIIHHNNCVDTTSCIYFSPTSIEDLFTKENVLTLSNPFSDKLNITTNYSEALEIILYDIASRKLLQQKFTNTITLNTAQLAKGIYLYEVRNNPDGSGGVVKKGKVVKE